MNIDFFKQSLVELLNIDSPTGMCNNIEEYIVSFIQKYKFSPHRMRKGGVWVDLGGVGDVLYIMVHCDTIGLVVNGINQDGTLKITYIGGLRAYSSERANVKVYTRKGNVYHGTIQRIHSSIHVAPIGVNEQPADYDSNLCLILDEFVASAQDVENLGIQVGDIISLSPDYVFTDNGYVKSRFLDDKVNVAISMALIKEIALNSIALSKHVLWGFTVCEEVGHGGSWIPSGVQDVLSVDIAPVGPLRVSKENQVTIYTQDTRFPYHHDMIQELIEVAEQCGIRYNLDIMYPKGGTDGDSSIIAGHDVRHTAIGPGVIGSHGYERTNIDGILSTYQLIKNYITR